MDHIWTFEVIRLDGPEAPVRVLESKILPKDLATKEHAREILEARCKGPSYRIAPAHKVRPEGVRFLDHEGREVLRYTVNDLHRDGGDVLPE